MLVDNIYFELNNTKPVILQHNTTVSLDKYIPKNGKIRVKLSTVLREWNYAKNNCSPKSWKINDCQA